MIKYRESCTTLLHCKVQGWLSFWSQRVGAGRISWHVTQLPAEHDHKELLLPNTKECHLQHCTSCLHMSCIASNCIWLCADKEEELHVHAAVIDGQLGKILLNTTGHSLMSLQHEPQDPPGMQWAAPRIARPSRRG